MLVEDALLEPVNAAMEVKRYAMTPTQPMSYLVGKQEIMDIRDEVKLRTAGHFNLHDFHESLLECGTLPPQLVRMELAERMPG